MIEAAAEVFFHTFPNDELEGELDELMIIYGDASSRRNELAHGVAISRAASSWYLEANMYSDKRDVKQRDSPFAYTSDQIETLCAEFSRLLRGVNGFRDRLQDHFRSSPPTLRARY